jgi:hypothetical protein
VVAFIGAKKKRLAPLKIMKIWAAQKKYINMTLMESLLISILLLVKLLVLLGYVVEATLESAAVVKLKLIKTSFGDMLKI